MSNKRDIATLLDIQRASQKICQESSRNTPIAVPTFEIFEYIFRFSVEAKCLE
jgi:hypothetical protein